MGFKKKNLLVFGKGKKKKKNVLEKMSFEEHKMIRLMCWERKNLFVFDKGEKKKKTF